MLTLSYQARETKRAREETRRQAISDLLKMAMDDPDLDECWGPIPEPDDLKSRKQQLYTNMIVAAWEASFEMGATPEHRLRYNANEMFRGPVGREYWRNAREGRISTSANSRERRFHQILDEEYQKIDNSEGRHSSYSGIQQHERDSSGRFPIMARRVLLIAVGAGIAILARRVLRRRGSRPLRGPSGVFGGQAAVAGGGGRRDDPFGRNRISGWQQDVNGSRGHGRAPCPRPSSR
ncbi:MAG: hypothetical protein J2P25_05885 [Nocardiopsaceae bacterium]|nr:hypothetical protein [Nocardiopsaceae bacterium]